MAFEPDPAALADLQSKLGTRWKQAVVTQTALGGISGTAPFYLYAHGVNHSLLPANPAFRDRYQVGSLADKGQISITLSTLDDLLFGPRAHEPYWGDLLKLDVQGAELDILRAAPQTLSQRTVAVVAEVCFQDIYRDQPHFSELEQFMAQAGFTFYGFLSLQGWSQKFLDKSQMMGNERLCFGDALFFRDPLRASNALAPLGLRAYQMLYLCAMLFGFYDFALELASEGEFSAEEAERLIRIAYRQAARSPEDATQHVKALLHRMTQTPDHALIELGRFVNAHRTQCEVADAALPRRSPSPRASRTSPPTGTPSV
jgi:FkbM family methyltransferase